MKFLHFVSAVFALAVAMYFFPVTQTEHIGKEGAHFLLAGLVFIANALVLVIED